MEGLVAFRASMSASDAVQSLQRGTSQQLAFSRGKSFLLVGIPSLPSYLTGSNGFVAINNEDAVWSWWMVSKEYLFLVPHLSLFDF